MQSPQLTCKEERQEGNLPHGWSCAVWPGLCILHKLSKRLTNHYFSLSICTWLSHSFYRVISNKEATIFPGSNSQWLPLYVCIWFVVWLFPKLYEQRAAFIFILSNKTYPLSIHWVSWKRSSKRVSISFPSLLENRDKNILALVLLLWMHIS